MDTLLNAPFTLRRAELSDLKALVSLELSCFDPARRSDARALKRSLTSERQLVIVACSGGELLGAMTIWRHPKRLRLYSIAVAPLARARGVGAALMRRFIEEGRQRGVAHLTLEMEASDERLRRWYERWGFAFDELKVGYYGEGRDALHLSFKLNLPQQPSDEREERVTTFVIVPKVSDWTLELPHVQAVTPLRYLSDELAHHKGPARVLNLCAPYTDQSLSYYCSLLAAARNHRVFPDVITIKDLDARATRLELTERLRDELDELKGVEPFMRGAQLSVVTLFGHALDERLSDLARALFRETGLPLAQLTLNQREGAWRITGLSALSLSSAKRLAGAQLERAAEQFFERKRFTQPHKLKRYRYDLAILVDPTESTPPSCPKALEELKKAGERAGFYVELLTTKDMSRLPEFDALLIRETTRVNHPSYQAARLAYAEGLAVIDDPWSILRCSNKVYLYERLQRARVKQPRSWLFYKGLPWREQHPNLTFPLVLKCPEGSFSTGVFKVASPEALDAQLEALWGLGELLIGQEFLPTAFDWRIGVLEQRPLFACQYFMAPGHWQIYQWAGSAQGASTADIEAGDANAVPLSEVPQAVLNTAVRAASLMGDGLYGVDLKMVGDQVYVIEVNDNPNLDRGIEDAVEGLALYDRVIGALVRRIEQARGLG